MIKNLINTIKTNNTFHFLFLLLLLTIPSFVTLFQPGYFGMHDDLQIMRIYEMDLCFKDNQFPCRWVPDMGYGYGYPLFNFYPVMPYYLGELIYRLGFSLIWSVKINFILSFLVSAITMFFLSRKFWGNLGGLLSALFYIYAPYHAVDVYVRGALAESWSLAWAPAVFLSIYLVIKEGNVKNILFLAASVALFLTSHNPMALIFTPVMAIWALIHLWQTKKFNNIFKLFQGSLWGLGLAAFFTLPVLFEGKLVHLETLFIGYFNYLAHFVGLNQLFISSFWGFGGSIWGPNDGMSFQIGFLHWGAVLITTLAGLLLWNKKRNLSVIVFFFIGVFWFSTFLIHPRSNPIWEKITILQTLQFPWRILALVIFSSSFLVGSLISLPVVKIKLNIALFIASLVGMLFLYQPYFMIEKPIPLTDREKLSGALWDLQRTAGIFDYLPKTAKFPPGKAVPESVEILSGTATVNNFKKGTNWLSFTIESSTGAKLKLPVIDFPEWKIFVDEKQIQFDNKNDLGQPTFDISSGKHQIFAKLFDTPIRTMANLISAISFILVIKVLLRLNKK